MIRFSLVLIEQDDFSYEFLGGEIIGNTIPTGKISERCIEQREAIIESRMIMLDAIIERI